MADSSFEFVFFFLGIVIFAVEVSQWISQKINIPQVLGEIFAGIIIGPTLLNLLSLNNGHQSFFQDIGVASIEDIILTESIFGFLAEMAALFLLLDVGLEIDFEMLKKVWRESVYVAIGGMILPFIAGFVFVFVLWDNFTIEGFPPLDVALFVGVMLTATSIGISIRVLIELDRIDADTTRIMIGAAIIDDILALGLFSLVFSYIEGEQASHAANAIGEILMLVGSILLFFVIVLIVDQLLHKAFIKKLVKQSDKYRTLTVSIGLLFLLSSVAGYLQLAPIIGAFMTGVIISRDKELAHEVVSLTKSISRWLVPLFFVAVGLRINLTVISSWSILFMSLLLGIIAVLSKIIGSSVGAKLQGQPVMESIEIGIGMSPRAEVIIIIATTGFEFGIIDSILYAMVVFTVAFSAIVAPFMLKRLISRIPFEEQEYDDLFTSV